MTPASYLPPIPQPPHDPLSWLLNARVGWQMGTLTNIESRPQDGDLALVPLPGAGRSLAESSGSFGGLVPPVNVAVGPGDSIFLLDLHSLQLKKFNSCACGFEVVPCFGGGGSGARQLFNPRGIAIHNDNLFVCDTGNNRLGVFALRQFAFRGNWSPPASAKLAAKWQPFAIAFDCRGRAFVTDPANSVVHRFDSIGRWEIALPGFTGVSYIAIDGQDKIHLVINGVVQTVDIDGNATTHGSTTRPELLGNVFPPMLFPVDSSGNLHLAALLEPDCIPIQQILPRGPKIPLPEPGVFDPDGNPITLPMAPAVPVFPQPVPPNPSGSYISSPLDSRLYRCQWHRISLRGCLPSGTLIIAKTYTSEVLMSPEQILNLPPQAWQTNQSVLKLSPTGEWDCMIRSPQGRYLWLMLLFYSNGFATPALQSIRIEFPRISLRRYLPAVFGAEPISADFTDRFLALFDTTFRSIEKEIDTQARLFDPLSAPAISKSAGGIDFLSWLASWIGVSLDSSWPVARQRAFLKSAGSLFNIRGTREGLWRQLILFLGMEPAENVCLDCVPKKCCPPKSTNCVPAKPPRAFGPPPLILEHFQLRRWLFVGAGRLSDDAVLWGSSIVNRSELDDNAQIGVTTLNSTPDPLRDPLLIYANRFTVFVPARFGLDPRQQRSLMNLLKTESPAHTQYYVKYVEPRFRIGVQSTIGLDAVIGRVPEGVTLGKTPLDGSRTLTNPPGKRNGPSFEIGKDARIGSTTRLT